MVPAGNKAKRLSSVNHTTKTIHHHHILKSLKRLMWLRWLVYPLFKFWLYICRIDSPSICCGNLGTCWIQSFPRQQTWPVLQWKKTRTRQKITRDVHEEVKKTILEDNQLPNPYPMCNSTTPTPSSTSYIPSSTPSTPSPTGDPTPCTHSHTTRSNDTYVYRVHTTLSLKIKNSSMKKISTTKTTSYALDFM